MADLINRQTLLEQMKAQEQAYYIETMRGDESNLVDPSWSLAIAMIEDMPKEAE